MKVPNRLYWKTRLAYSMPSLMRRLGNMESAILRDDIDGQPINAPIFVTGLARAGTTVVTQILSEHPTVASHRYADFPFVDVPFWRNWLEQRAQIGPTPAVQERAHGDRIQVSNSSPEAFEETIWLKFFDWLHDETRDQRMEADFAAPAFESFYRDHIRKLLLVHGAKRYLAKNNYNLSRLPYLGKLFPDARLVIVIRQPIDHVVSLMRQHQRFVSYQKADSRTAGQLSRSGHHEFGPDRRLINLGDDQIAQQIRSDWDAGREAQGWARYWAHLYEHVANVTTSLADQCLVVRFEDLCDDSAATLDRLTSHCNLARDDASGWLSSWETRLSRPDYYTHGLSQSETHDIARFTAPVAAQFGY